jgi:hypothetical protein
MVLAFALAGAPGCSVVGDVVRRPLHGLDLNTATVDELAKLPGLTQTDAARIAERRPYQLEEDLVSRGIVSQEQLAGFGHLTYVGRGRDDETRSCAPVPQVPEPAPPGAADEPSEDDDEEP